MLRAAQAYRQPFIYSILYGRVLQPQAVECQHACLMPDCQLHYAVSAVMQVSKAVITIKVAFCQKVSHMVQLWSCSGAAAMRQTCKRSESASCLNHIQVSSNGNMAHLQAFSMHLLEAMRKILAVSETTYDSEGAEIPFCSVIIASVNLRRLRPAKAPKIIKTEAKTRAGFRP